MTEDHPRQDAGEAAAATGEAGLPMTVTQRFGLIFSQPSVAFRGLRESRWVWLWPALVIALCMVIAPQFVSDLQAEKQIRAVDELVDRGLVQEEGADELRQRIREGAEDTGIAKAVLWSTVGTVYKIAFRFLLPAAVLLLGVRFVMAGRARYSEVLAALSFASLPAALREIVRTPLQMSKGDLDVSFGPAMLTGTDTVSGYALGLIDLFDLWILYLLVIGLAEVGPLSRGRAATLVVPLWIVFSLFKLGMRASPFGSVF